MSMFNTNSKPHRKIYAGQKHFYFSPDGITLVPRAGFEVNKNCPTEYKQMLMTAIDLGWIKPVANMPDEEYMWENLRS